ncbi:MAG: hypothetical protein DI537_37880 [Stutzerimonas stutzeri]|nr:MAG: hypothetical protein DI537_37880 [Stutzerimonas stutzeri]
MEGAADLLFAEKKCGFRIDMDHLNRWLETRGVMSPDALDYINSTYERAIRVNRELTENQCALAKASAKSIGALAE